MYAIVFRISSLHIFVGFGKKRVVVFVVLVDSVQKDFSLAVLVLFDFVCFHFGLTLAWIIAQLYLRTEIKEVGII